MDWPALVEGIFRDARDDVSLRLVIAALVGLVSVLVVAGHRRLRRWWIERSAKRQAAARALREQGEYHVQLKHRHEAMELFDLSVQLNPREGRVYYLRGCLHAELGDPDRAIADWRRCLARLPRHRDAQRRLAEIGRSAQPMVPRWAYLWGAVAVLLFFTLVGLGTR
ncbi:MAG TPA: tetratricopeptide repeat protein [Hyphomicrobiaceae bacterium]|nr:tetratricopeptide repeat protein [Hyphomicrobiaceae bacterium]